MYPEDYPISEGRLRRLWAAEGFIKPTKDKNFDELADEYLSELVLRNLVSVEIKYGYRKLYRVHDLMREVILIAADEFSFLRIVGESSMDRSGKYRRLSFHNTTLKSLKTIGEYSAHSVFLFDVDAEFAKSFVVNFLRNFKLLKVVDFQWAPINRLPTEVGDLFHLEYLNLKGTNLKELPKSIGKLQNLQTLDIRSTLIHELPLELYKLRKLRHLSAYRLDKELEYNSNSYPGLRMRQGIGSLQELQTLKHVELYPNQEGFIRDLEKLRNLKILSLSKLTAQTAKALGASIDKMKSLKEMTLTAMDDGEVLDLNLTWSPPRSLQYVSLKCRLCGFPEWISELQSLRGLSMRFSWLSEDPLSRVSHLPSLEFLRLYQVYDGEQLSFEEGGFGQLKHLEMRKLEGLKRVKIERGALPRLEELIIGDFPSMSDVAFDVQHLTSLKSLEIGDMGREFVASLQPEGGAEYWRIEHVRSVRFSLRRDGWAVDSHRLESAELLRRLQEGGN